MSGTVCVGGTTGALSCSEVVWSLAGRDFAGFKASGYVLSNEFEAAGFKLQLGLYKTSDKSVGRAPGGGTESGIFVFCGGPGPSGYRIAIHPGETRVCKAHRFEGKSENYGFWAWALCRMPPVQELCISVTLLQASDLIVVDDLERVSVEAEVADVMAADAKSCGNVAAAAAPGASCKESRPMEFCSNTHLPQQCSNPPATPRGCSQVPRLHWQPVLKVSVESPGRQAESKQDRVSSGSSCTLSSSESSSSGSWSSSTSSGYESPAAGTGSSPARCFPEQVSGMHEQQPVDGAGTGGSPDRKALARRDSTIQRSNFSKETADAQIPSLAGPDSASLSHLDRVAAALNVLEQVSRRTPLSPAPATLIATEAAHQPATSGGGPLWKEVQFDGASCINDCISETTMQVFDPIVNIYERIGSNEVIRVIEIECGRVSAENIDWQETPGGLLVTIQKRKEIDEAVVKAIGPLWQPHGEWAREFPLHDTQGRFDIGGTECWLKDGTLSISARRPLQVRRAKPRHDAVALCPLRHLQRRVEPSIYGVVAKQQDSQPCDTSTMTSQHPTEPSQPARAGIEASVPQAPRIAPPGCTLKGSKTISATSRPAMRLCIPKLNLASAPMGLGDGCCPTTRGGA